MTKSWEKKKDALGYYDQTAVTYDSLYGDEQKKKYAAAIKNAEKAWSGKILDVGCGSGLFEEFLEENSVEEFSAYGIDISIELIKKAKGKFLGKKNIFFICADADFLPFPRELFDFCISYTLIQNLPEPVLSLIEFKRVCKRSAILILSCPEYGYDLHSFDVILKQVGFKYKIWKCSDLKEHIACAIL